MIILHDNPNSDLSNIQAMAGMKEEFALFDYVRIEQEGKSWIGQIVQPNRNISTVGNPLNPTILHGLKLMQSNPDVQSVESVQVFDILMLGEYNGSQMLTPRTRPLPGAPVTRLDIETISRVIGLPQKARHADGSFNVIGELLNADDVPLCVDGRAFNHHIMIAGGTGSGKSNIAANLINQAMKFNKCVLVHDAKPDYGRITSKNSDPNVNVKTIWKDFDKYGLKPRSANRVTRVGFHGKCVPKRVDIVAGCRASDLSPAMLAGFFFPRTEEELQFERFVSAANSLSKPYSLDDILNDVKRRMGPNIDPEERIHASTGNTILGKVEARREEMPWLDAIDDKTQGQSPRQYRAPIEDMPRSDAASSRKVHPFNFNVNEGRILVIDYSQMDDSSYALLLSYVLQYCQEKRKNQEGVGIIHMVDEAHRIFDNESRYSDTLAGSFNRIMREGRTRDHSIVLSLQNASQIPQLVMNNLNTHMVMHQNSKDESDSATQTMGRDFSVEALRLGTGHALVKMFESRNVVLVQMAPSPFDLMRTDNIEANKK